MYYLIGLIIVIVVIGFIYGYIYIKNKRQAESFTDNTTNMIFSDTDYITNKGTQSGYEYHDGHLIYPIQPIKKLGTITTFLNNLLDNSNTISKPEPKCLSCENVFNKSVFFKQGPAHYLGYDANTNVIRLLSKASMTADQFMKCCGWKLVLGLAGDANTCSILHMEQDSYLIRLPNDKLIIQPAEVIHGNELERQMATFRLIDGLGARSSISLMPLPIGKETQVRVVVISDSGVPRIVKYDSEHVINYKASTFECVDTINEYPVFTNRFTVNGEHKCNNASITQNLKLSSGPMFEPFQDTSNGPNRRCNKSSSKRLLAGCVEEGELTPNELSQAELFQNSNTTSTNSENIYFRPDFNPKSANIFDAHTGAEFNAILNTGVSQKRNELTDNIFYKLENAKMDPDVNNLLEYNESRYNIYKKENADFESKIYERIKNHTDTVDNLIVDMNNYRVKNMAQDFFFLGDKLIKSRGSNNSS